VLLPDPGPPAITIRPGGKPGAKETPVCVKGTGSA
jgi:hypothetical protein